MPFTKATKHAARLRMALIGPAGSGKTMSALKIGSHLGQRLALIDTERGSASKYADKFGFDVCELTTFDPRGYVQAIQEAEQAGYDVLIIDSLSHAWSGMGGVLEFVDTQAKRSQSSNTFGAWREATPLHNALVDAMLGAGMHVIVTMRAKTEYVQEKDANGKTQIRKVGLQPVQRDGLEYEFDVVGDLTADNELVISKTRCEDLTGKVFAKPGKDVADVLANWLTGEPLPERPTGNGHDPKVEQPRDGIKGGTCTECQEIIDPQAVYVVKGHDVPGATLIRVSMQRCGQVRCGLHLPEKQGATTA